MSKPLSEAAKLQRRFKKNATLMGKVMTEHYALIEQLQGICDHSEVEDYKWEHDNGYGRQSDHVGKRCRFCGWIDRWNDGKFYKLVYEDRD